MRLRPRREGGESDVLPPELLLGSVLQLRDPEGWVRLRAEWLKGQDWAELRGHGLTPLSFMRESARGAFMRKAKL